MKKTTYANWNEYVSVHVADYSLRLLLVPMFVLKSLSVLTDCLISTPDAMRFAI